MNQELKDFLQQQKDIIEDKLPQHIQKLQAPQSLKDAMIYSLQAGGKRIRPVLLLATLRSFGKSLEYGIDIACAIEMIHTYSLIHDDLPAMDDDDLRRGKPTNHKVFGEAVAILAGDALLTYSFELIASLQTSPPHIQLLLIRELAKAAGPEGMVGGQVADLEGENKTLELEDLAYIHHHKTGDLLAFSVIAGAILAGAEVEEVENLRKFARELGLLFQIKDDILDVEGDVQTIGKPVGSDDGNNKSTYVSLLGIEEAKTLLTMHTLKAKEYLYGVNMDHAFLDSLTEYIVHRDH
ncbi:polyprenyl synthetase family protein [Halalkalibacter urbisdiaboli]|uniref:polyprenyl synthetase family protein n=1 Tax=Halalkalibacter urbisdiaboli TaxID=1960589 RepID=UPI000B42E4E0|nr:farnesyl diphosphate synthase [Halalkalibacter urbisdiaboli]